MKTIEEKNKLIAEYMNIEVMTIEELRIIAKENRKNGLIHVPQREIIEDLKYHDSWDLLMPVVEEIGAMMGGYNIVHTLMELDETASSIGDIHDAVIDWIIDFKNNEA